MNRSREEEEDHIVNHLRPHPKCHSFLLASGHFRVPHLHTFAPTTPHTPTQSATFWSDSVVECFLDADIACTADSRRQTLRFQKAGSCKLQVGNRFSQLCFEYILNRWFRVTRGRLLGEGWVWEEKSAAWMCGKRYFRGDSGSGRGWYRWVFLCLESYGFFF